MKFSEFITEAIDKKLLISKLERELRASSRLTERDVQREDESLDVRHWGQWEVPEDEEDDGDYDWEVLTQASAKKLKDLITKFEKENKCKVNVQTSEKNWIAFSIK